MKIIAYIGIMIFLISLGLAILTLITEEPRRRRRMARIEKDKLPETMNVLNDTEVIGNIYENPELLTP